MERPAFQPTAEASATSLSPVPWKARRSAVPRTARYHRPVEAPRTYGLRLRTTRGNVPHMFRRHRNDPEPTLGEALRDRLESLAVSSRTARTAVDRSLVRRHIATSASASHGLRDRLRQPILSTPQG